MVLRRLSGFAAVAGLSAMLAMPIVPAQASPQGQDALLGAGIGAIAGGLLGHGQIGPMISGAAVGVAIGALAAPHNKHTGHYYDEHGNPHRYTYKTDRYGNAYDFNYGYGAQTYSRYSPYGSGYSPYGYESYGSYGSYHPYRNYYPYGY